MNGSPMQQRLKSLLHVATERWIYAIFWDTTIANSGVSILAWGDGFHAGNNDEDRTKQFFDLSTSQFYDSAGSHLLASAPAWFTAENENPCFRTRQALAFGIGTMASFPLYRGVLELGSTYLIQPSTSDIHSKIFAVFGFDTAQLQLMNPNIPVPEAEKLSRKRLTDLAVKREAARKRQKRLTDGIEALRAVIPNGLKKNWCSLLVDAVTNINSLSCEVETAESVQAELQTAMNGLMSELAPRRGHREAEDKMRFEGLKMEVKMIGRGEALIRMESRELRNPAATLMEALRELELEVVFAAMMMVEESLVQQVKVVVEDGRYTEAQLTSALMEIF